MTLIQTAASGEALKLAFQEVHQAQIRPKSGLLNVDDIVHCVDTLCTNLGCTTSDLPPALQDIAAGTSLGFSVTPTQMIDALLDAREAFAA